jgi:hypothetical protein
MKSPDEWQIFAVNRGLAGKVWALNLARLIASTSGSVDLGG